ncbi:MAG: hypothetical protein HRT87_09030 [Legionellales bacterium]|nr:hypothetical protein [Legionellales bacterium]
MHYAEYLKKIKEMVKKLDPNTNDFQESIKELMKFIREGNQQHQNLLSQIINDNHKAHLHDLAVGFGKEDFLGSTKLGSGTGIILHAALGQGTEGGGINADRESALNVKIEQAVNQAEKELSEEINEQKFNPSPFTNKPTPY